MVRVKPTVKSKQSVRNWPPRKLKSRSGKKVSTAAEADTSRSRMTAGVLVLTLT